MLSIPFIPVYLFDTDFSNSMRAKVFKLCIHLQTFKVYCVQEKNGKNEKKKKKKKKKKKWKKKKAKLNSSWNLILPFFFHFFFFFFFFFFHFFHFYSNVMHREICVKTFSGLHSRNSKLGTNIGYVWSHRARDNQPPLVYHFLCLSIVNFLFLVFLSNKKKKKKKKKRNVNYRTTGLCWFNCGEQTGWDLFLQWAIFRFFLFASLTPM